MRRSLSAVLLASHLMVGAASAQTVSATMGAIDGRVTDNTTGVLPGVTVTISGPAMMGTRVATTNDQGAYRIAAVPPGDYTVVFELDGFAPLRRAGIRVDLGFTATVNVQMAIGAVAENVTVTGASSTPRPPRSRRRSMRRCWPAFRAAAATIGRCSRKHPPSS